MDDIIVESLKKSFGKSRAVDDISFSVKHGEIFGLLGVNGAGKTTTINLLTGILEKDSGEIRILGRSPEKVKGQLNVCSAYNPLAGNLTIWQNLLVFAMIYRIEDRKGD